MEVHLALQHAAALRLLLQRVLYQQGGFEHALELLLSVAPQPAPLLHHHLVHALVVMQDCVCG